jgi:hypothetical protein
MLSFVSLPRPVHPHSIQESFSVPPLTEMFLHRPSLRPTVARHLLDDICRTGDLASLAARPLPKGASSGPTAAPLSASQETAHPSQDRSSSSPPQRPNSTQLPSSLPSCPAAAVLSSIVVKLSSGRSLDGISIDLVCRDLLVGSNAARLLLFSYGPRSNLCTFAPADPCSGP